MPFLSTKYKRKFFKILPFGIIWLLLGWVFLFIEYAVLSDSDKIATLNSSIVLSPKIVLFASVSVFAVGCLVGILEVWLINKFFVEKSFPVKLFGKLLFYSMLMFFLMFVFYQIAASLEMNMSVFSKAVFNRYLLFLNSITHLSTLVQLAFSLFVSLLYAEIRDNLGQNVLLNFFTGKYHKPIVENRIFMFTDMKDSTAIAEKLGNVNYFKFLRNYYNDLSSAILNYHGEVYQYIGDEIVISWQNNKQNSSENSVYCFLKMQQDLIEKRGAYLKEYGIFPEFKAAIHKGEVTVGEIGALKKEIFFTGDVLNTTARIQSLCSKFNMNLLVSKAIANDLDQSKFVFKNIDNVVLKGKINTINIIGIVEKENK